MHLSYFALVLLNGGMIYLMACGVLRYFLRPKLLEKMIQEKLVEIEKTLHQKMAQTNFQHDIDEILDRHLNDLVLIFKQQIPMAELFLSGNLITKLKGQAKNELMKMMPELKEKVMERMAKELDLKQMLSNQIQNFPLSTLCRRMALAIASAGTICTLIVLGIIIKIWS